MVKVLPVPALASQQRHAASAAGRRRRRPARAWARVGQGLHVPVTLDHLLVLEQAVPEPPRRRRPNRVGSAAHPSAASSAAAPPTREDHAVEREHAPRAPARARRRLSSWGRSQPDSHARPQPRRPRPASAAARPRPRPPTSCSRAAAARTCRGRTDRRGRRRWLLRDHLAGSSGPSPSGADGRHVRPCVLAARPRPIVSARNARSGQVAVSGEQMQPRDEAERGPSRRVRHAVHHVAAHARDRADEGRRAGQVDMRRRPSAARVALRAACTRSSSGSLISVSTGVGQRPGRQRPAGELGGLARRLVGAAEPRREHPVADLPALERVELDRDGVVEVAGLVAQRDVSRSRRNARTGWRTNRSSWSRPTGRRRTSGGSGPRGTAAARAAAPTAARAPARWSGSKLQGPSGHQRSPLEVAGVERLQRVR